MTNIRLLIVMIAVWSSRAAFAAGFTVTMNSTFFTPATLSIGQGDTVTWTNHSGITHTSTSGSSCLANGLWDSAVANNASFSRTFTSAGSFPYYCTPHCAFGMVGSLTVTNTGNTPPSVSITNPVSGARFHAPATFALQATASDSGGSVTNVQFFSGASLLGNLTAPPFNFALNNLAAGNYSFTAKATDNSGATTTSAAIAVFVETNATLSGASRGPGGDFQFTINGIAGQTYAIEASSNLTSWLPLATNVAPSDSFPFSDPASTNLPKRFYRVRQDL